MKKIISFTDYYWPGYKAGGTIRAFMNQVEYLKDQFEFFIVTRNTDYTDTEPYPGVVPDCWTRISPNVSVFYVSAGNQKISTFSRLLSEQRYDVIYIHLLFGFWYSMLPLYLAKKQKYTKIIIASHGNLGAGALGVKSSRKKYYLSLAKAFGVYRHTVFHSVTEHETEDIKKHIGGAVRIMMARELPRKVMDPPMRNPKVRGRLRIVTVARIAPEKNQSYALEVLSRCRDHEIQYDLIGPVYEESYWTRCQSLIATMPPNVKVSYRGSINSEKIPSELTSYDIMLLPTTGENFGHTILESFMSGCPVVISDRTPWKNLAKAGTGMDVPLEDPDSFQKAIEQFATMDDLEFAKWSAAAFSFSRDYVSNPEMLAENVNLFNI